MQNQDAFYLEALLSPFTPHTGPEPEGQTYFVSMGKHRSLHYDMQHSAPHLSCTATAQAELVMSNKQPPTRDRNSPPCHQTCLLQDHLWLFCYASKYQVKSLGFLVLHLRENNERQTMSQEESALSYHTRLNIGMVL